MTSLLEKLASVELMAEQFESIVRSAEADIHGSDHSASSFADARGSADTSSLNDANMPRPARERTTSWGGSMRKWRHFRAYRAKVVPGPDPGLSCESRAPRAYRAKVAPEAKFSPQRPSEAQNFAGSLRSPARKHDLRPSMRV